MTPENMADILERLATTQITARLKHALEDAACLARAGHVLQSPEVTRVTEPPELETPCHACNGRGHPWEASIEPRRCPSCNGTGYRITAHGAALLRFLDRHHTSRA